MKSAYLLAAAAAAWGSAQGASPARAPGGHVIVDQTAGGTGACIVSQNFEVTFQQYDQAAADAFTIKKSASVTSVVANGTYFDGSGPATSESVTFYADAHGTPGKAVKGCSYADVVGHDASGAFTIALKPACKLGKGIYWVSVVANLDFSQDGEWGWCDATETGPYQAEYQVGHSGWKALSAGLNYELLGRGR